MLSIIICSADPGKLDDIAGNIDGSIGTPYEILSVDNRDRKYGLCEAYNRLAEKARYDSLVFVHDDVEFESAGWGIALIGLLKEKSVGLIGVAGNKYNSSLAVPYWYFDKECNFIQSFKSERKDSVYKYINNENVPEREVIVLDGVFISARKDTWEKARYDEIRFKGFHCYDVDFSLHVKALGYRNIVSEKILLRHFSEGSLDEEYWNTLEAVHEKWNRILPMSLLPDGQTRSMNEKALEAWFKFNPIHSRTSKLINGYRFARRHGVQDKYYEILKKKALGL